MSKYIVTYDLRKPGQNYDALIAAIKKYTWAKVTESSWFIKTSDSASVVRDNLTRHIDSGDRLMVAALTGEAAWLNCIASGDDIKKLLND
jgi:hypothetical protein